MRRSSKAAIQPMVLDRHRLDQHCAAEGCSYSMGVASEDLAESLVNLAVGGVVAKAMADGESVEVIE